MKTRCQGCSKKISIDEAFAGGVCRCPYCKAITVVPAAEQSPLNSSARPERPGRPESPTAPVPVPPAPVQQPQQPVPLANRVMIQGVVTIVMSVLLVLFLVTGIAGIWWLTRPEADVSPASTRPSTVVPGGESFAQQPGEIAGLAMQSPTVFVLDASVGMRDYYDPAAAMIRHAVRSSKPSDKFQVVLAGEQMQRMSDDWIKGGPEADPLLARFFARISPGGKSQLRQAVLLALESKPRTLVILSSNTIPDASALAQQVAAGGAHIVGVALGDLSAVAEVMKKLAQETGGQSVSIPDPVSWLEHAPQLPVYQPEE